MNIGAKPVSTQADARWAAWARSKMAYAAATLALATSVHGAESHKCVGPDGRVRNQPSPCSRVQPGPSSAQIDNGTAIQGLILRCAMLRLDSPEYPACAAELACREQGKEGKALNACIAEKQSEKQTEAAATIDRRRASAEGEAAKARRAPAVAFAVGSRWTTEQLEQALAGYPGSLYFPDDSSKTQAFRVVHEGKSYVGQTTRVREGKPATVEVSTFRQGDLSTGTSRSTVECSQLYGYAEARGHGFFERSMIVNDAKKNNLCK